MRIVYTRHARERMSQRRVSEEQVLETLLSPDKILPGAEDEGWEDDAMRINYDPNADAMYVHLRDGEIDDTVEAP